MAPDHPDHLAQAEPSVAREVLLLSCGAFASAAALRMCDPMLPALGRDFGTSVAGAAVVVTATSVAYGFCQLLFGPLGDRYGKFRVISWACLVSTLGALACALSPTLSALSFARAFTGATTAALIPLSMAWIGDAVSFEQRQPTLAKFMSGQILGVVSGQAIGGFFSDTVGWRWAFVFLATAYFSVGVLLLRDMRRQAAAVVARTAIPLLAGLRSIFVEPRARAILATVFIEAMAAFGVMAFVPAYLHQRFGVSLFLAGSVVALVGVGGLFYSLAARRWVHWLGQIKLARLGGSLLGVSFLMIAWGPSWAWSIPGALLCGFGFYQLHNTLQTHATQMAPAARGMAVSIFASCFFLGQAIGVTLASMVVERIGEPLLFSCSAVILPLVGWNFAARLKRWAAAR